MALIETNKLTMRFGGLTAVNAVDMSIEKKTIHALIGPNGAGKTTLFNMISGLYKPTSGSIVFDGRDITKYKPYQATYAGVARTFQNILLFENLSVVDNVMVGRHCRMKCGLPQIMLRTPWMKRDEAACADRARELVEFVGLGAFADAPAGSLPYGNKRLLEIGRALASDPKLLLLDEPAAGMNDSESAALVSLIRKIRDLGVTVLLVEHNIRLVMGLSDRITVLNYGNKIADGTPEEVMANQDVIDAYLGKEDDDGDEFD